MNLFASPHYFLYLPVILAVSLAVIWLGNVRKKSILHALFGPAAYRKLTKDLRPVPVWRNALFLGGIVCLFTALAGPQWGREVVQQEALFAQTVIAVDVSSSMRAQDLKPNRLENAKQMLQMLVNRLREERIGIIAFTSEAYIQCPVTTDTDALDYFVSILRPDMLPVVGTSLAAPVKVAAQMLSKYPGQKALILLTDGEDHDPEQLASARKIAQENQLRIITIGIGTDKGALIPERVDEQGNAVDYKKDRQGKTVLSKLDENTLIELAKDTGGAYIAYTSPAQVARQVEMSLRGLDKSVAKTAQHTLYKNRYALPLALAILCFTGYLLWPRGRKTKTPSKKVQ
jgi:Ca-activated chloride channel family protein